MKHPPPDDERGAASAATLTTPDRASSFAGNQNSGRRYHLRKDEVNPRPSDAVPRVSEAGTDAAGSLSPAERVYLEICKAQTGRELPAEVQERSNEARRLLLAQSYRIADALVSEGIPSYGPSNLSLVGVLSGLVVELPDFRNIVFIPSVAQRKRHKMLKHLEYFMQEHPFARMWVFTSGDRVPLSGVRERIAELHRRLSKLNAEPFLRAAGIEIVFRSTELGEVTRDASGSATFHIHSHVIVDLKRKLSKDDWSHVLGAVRKWWKHHFADSKQIHQAREACKYVVKPGDLDKLSAPELAQLHHQLFRLHMVQCLGSLKDQKKQIEETRTRLIKLPEGLESRWKMVAEWNQSRTKKDGLVVAPYDTPPTDWIVCTLQPSFALSGRAEPLAVVLNYSGKRISDNRRIMMLREICGPRYQKSPTSPGEEEKPLLQRRRGIKAS
jgi:hypothetical protein